MSNPIPSRPIPSHPIPPISPLPWRSVLLPSLPLLTGVWKYNPGKSLEFNDACKRVVTHFGSINQFSGKLGFLLLASQFSGFLTKNEDDFPKTISKSGGDSHLHLVVTGHCTKLRV